MNSYKVDECLDSKKLVAACAAEGLVQIRRCPRRLKQFEDPDVLEKVLPSECTLLTTDRSIHFEHGSFIPNEHSGILIIATCRLPQTLGFKVTAKILRGFKERFPDWHSISLRNAVMEITEEQTEVWRVEDGNARRISVFRFETPGWQDNLRGLLVRLASEGGAVADKDES